MRYIDQVITDMEQIVGKRHKGRNGELRELIKELKEIREYPKWKRVRDWIAGGENASDNL